MTEQPQDPRPDTDRPALPPASNPYPVPYDAAYKPAKVTAIAVLTLVDGVFNVLFAAGLFFGLLAFGVSTFGCGCILLPLGLYPLALGIIELVYGTQILPQDPREVSPARWLAILQVVNVLFGQVLSVVAGILALVFLDDPEVRAWFARRAPWTPPGSQGGPQGGPQGGAQDGGSPPAPTAAG